MDQDSCHCTWYPEIEDDVNELGRWGKAAAIWTIRHIKWVEKHPVLNILLRIFCMSGIVLGVFQIVKGISPIKQNNI